MGEVKKMMQKKNERGRETDGFSIPALIPSGPHGMSSLCTSKTQTQCPQFML